jgi:hypothetical protein
MTTLCSRPVAKPSSILAFALILATGAALAANDPSTTALRTVHDDATGLTVTVPEAWELADREMAGRQLVLARAAPYDGNPKRRPVLMCMELALPGVAPAQARERIEAMLDHTWRLAPPTEKIEIAPVAREDLSNIEAWRTRIYYPAEKQTTAMLLLIRDGKGIYCSAAWGETHGEQMQAAWKSLAIEPLASKNGAEPH